MLKSLISIFLIVISAFTMTACDSKEVRACKKLAHKQIEEVCNGLTTELEKLKENQEEYDAVLELTKSQYPVCFDGDLMKQVFEKLDLACESDPSVATRQTK